jgi:YHS domain-containing protein
MSSVFMFWADGGFPRHQQFIFSSGLGKHFIRGRYILLTPPAGKSRKKFSPGLGGDPLAGAGRMKLLVVIRQTALLKTAGNSNAIGVPSVIFAPARTIKVFFAVIPDFPWRKLPKPEKTIQKPFWCAAAYRKQKNFAGFIWRRGKQSVQIEHNLSKHMKNTALSMSLLAGAFGVLALAAQLTAAECAMPSCCAGAAETTTLADAKATPDLLATCPVSGEKLGEMGKPFSFVYKDQEVKLCCKGCKKDFDKDPEKYMKLIRAADKK